MKTFVQGKRNVVNVSCFELTITDEQNDIALVGAKPISDEEGYELVPYTFRINNTCEVYGYVDVNLEIMDLGSEVKEILPEHIHAQLLKSGIELFNDVLNLEYETEPTLVGAHLSYRLNRQFIKANSYEDYALRIWMDKDITNDDLDTIGGSFKSKINIIFQQTDPLFDRSGTIVPAYDSDRGIDNSNKYFWQYRNTISDIIVENTLTPKESYIESWDMSEEQDGSVIAYVLDNGDETQTLYLQGIGGIKMPESCYCFFQYFYKTHSIQNIELLDFSNVTDMSYMFCYFGQNALGDINFDLSSMDASNVTNMFYMFAYFGYNLIGNGSIYFGNDFNAENVITMDYFMYNAFYSAKGNINISLGNNFNASNVTNINYAFGYVACNSSSNQINIDLGTNFNLQSVSSSVNCLFDSVGNNYTNKPGSVTISLGDNFNASNVTFFSNCFRYIGSYAHYVKIDLGKNFNANKLTSMYEMFRNFGLGAKNIEINFGDNFGGESVTDMSYLFYLVGYSDRDCDTLNIDFGDYFDTSKVTNMKGMFYFAGRYAKNITVDFGDYFDTSNVTDMSYMFSEFGIICENFNINFSDKFNTVGVTNMSDMFHTTNLDFDISFLNFQSAQDLGCFAQRAYNIYGNIFIDFNNVTNYSNTFVSEHLVNNQKILIDYTSSTEAALDTALSHENSSYPGKVLAKKGNLLGVYPYPLYSITVPEGITPNTNSSLSNKKIELSSNISNKVITSFKLNGQLVETSWFIMPAEDVEITDVELVDGVIVESEHYPYPTNMYYKNYYENTFSGANSLTIELTYETYGTYYNWIYLYTDSSTIYQNKKFGGNLNTEIITIQGDYIKIVFNNNNSYTWANNCYGFKAVIIPHYD